MNSKIFIILPAFNEESRIAKVVEEIEKYADKIIVIDDGSTDNTIQRINSSKVIILKHLVNLGQGAALATGIKYAIKKGAQIIVTYDADGQFRAKEIPLLIKPIVNGKADVVLGSRFLGKAIEIPFQKRTILKLGIIFTYIFSGIKLTDTHNGFRAFNRKAISSIKITQNKMAHASEIIDQIKKNNLKYVEMPVTITYYNNFGKKGQRTINSVKIFFDLIIDKLK